MRGRHEGEEMRKGSHTEHRSRVRSGMRRETWRKEWNGGLEIEREIQATKGKRKREREKVELGGRVMLGRLEQIMVVVSLSF